MTATNETGAATGKPLVLLRAEGVALVVFTLAAYTTTNTSWWLFPALILLPDITLLAYLAGPRLGALLYNTTHTTIPPIVIGVLGIGLGLPLAKPVALIWLAHIGIDRALGYGLKYEDGFAFTHLGRVGKRAAS